MTFKMINVRLLKHKHNLTSTSQNWIVPKIGMLNTSKHTYTHNQNKKQKTKKNKNKQKQKTNRSFTQEPQKCTIFQKQKHIDMHKYIST